MVILIYFSILLVQQLLNYGLNIPKLSVMYVKQKNIFLHVFELTPLNLILEF